ncbi:unnamed protein product [Diabrotica balteata]|uniref:Endonuclease-reverse transcriptase n=1 Tax=Diabrotica balteata TaxID=107213 RepID=A0A9N9X8V4_DIABA|nr:unnamed protein product [Diabrotica balteata]
MTSTMKIGPQPQIRRPLIIENDAIEAVNEFVYLGTLVNTENDTTSEINRRICTANRCYFGLNLLFKSTVISRNTKVKLYKTIIRPVLTYGSETWTLTKSNENMLGCFERKRLRRIYRAVNENGVCRRRYNFELYRIYHEPDIVKHIKIGRLTWVGHVMRMEQTDPARKRSLIDLLVKEEEEDPEQDS